MAGGGEIRAAVRFEALGVQVEVRADNPELETALTRLLRGFAPIAGSVQADVIYSVEPEESGWRLIRNGEQLRYAVFPVALLHWLFQDLNGSVVERTPHVTLHAGGVTRSGAALVMPAKGESGKTTLTAGLVRAGCNYLSDEAVAIDRATGHAVPYPKPISLDVGAQPFFPELSGVVEPLAGGFEWQWHIPPGELGSGVMGSPCPVGAVIFPRYERGASTSLARVGPADALVELAENTFRFDSRPRESLDVLAGVVRGAPCYRLITGDLPPAVSAVLELVDSLPRAIGEPAA